MGKKTAVKPRHYLREWRQYREMTLEQLAEAVGTTKGVISELELSKKGLSLKWLYRLAPALQTSPGMIVDYHPEMVDHEAMAAFLSLGGEEKNQVLKIIGALKRKAG
jgi:transcriptional regulator with XRE-family HTH domain